MDDQLFNQVRVTEITEIEFDVDDQGIEQPIMRLFSACPNRRAASRRICLSRWQQIHEVLTAALREFPGGDGPNGPGRGAAGRICSAGSSFLSLFSGVAYLVARDREPTDHDRAPHTRVVAGEPSQGVSSIALPDHLDAGVAERANLDACAVANLGTCKL